MVPMMVSARLEVVDLGTAPDLDPSLSRAVDDVWRSQLAINPALHDGELFTVTSVDPTRLAGRYVPYRRFVAQQAEPALRRSLEIAPLAVTGRSVTSDRRLVVARRGRAVTQNPGSWEMAPAGGVDRSARLPDGRVDLRLAVHGELGDELGLCADDVVSVQPVALVVDQESQVHDVVVDVLLWLSSRDVVARFSGRRTEEYDRVTTVPLEDVTTPLDDGPRVAGFDEMASLPFVV